MQIDYSLDAFTSLAELVNFIERTNTLGAGLRWLSKYEKYLEKTFRAPHNFRLCHNQTFSNLHLNCIYFNDWVIAFSIHEESVLIEAILHKSRISD